MIDKPNTDDSPLPLLWLYGPGGVGKSAVGWELFTRLSREGTPIGYVDIDQIGMCYAAPTAENWVPEPASDRVRYRLKSRSLDTVAARFRAAGARGLIVSGIIDPVRGIDTSLLPHAAVTPCRLRVDRDEHLRRLTARGRPDEPLDEILQDAEDLDRNSFPGVVIDTTGLDLADVLGQVSKKTSGWPGSSAVRPSAGAAYGGTAEAPGEILWLSGPTGVGKSTVGWSVYMKSRLAGLHTAFLDLDQVGFLRPASAEDPGNHRLKAGNLAGIWRNFSASGTRRLVILGPLDRPEAAELYRAALPEATMTLCRMGVGRAQLDDRIARRGRGEAPGIAGDELKGLPQQALREACDRAWAEALAFERSGVADFSVATDGRTSPEIAEEILDRVGWVRATGT
ncbi:hypothetical protein [Streptacidiphilus sp. P02-A3a]|uniref:hypothetical protein n=1 Tax=Streptacidiphilus sp. P02-A3a TaxID=2704468 RepID=UPI0015F7FCF3|nr:hypothetical protein [Streptacidiphilus sp. P02-A3a]QMU70871.1 hypothetical protein GXP74_24285 [Streptacidiphilus sp. P02-A3a]